ncbi:hypothetical protein [Micrococcus endophyticus]|uniref:Alpha/beta hydrolase n=1 Tax=Micrococcus endophyticus TaxID=455343 RepID=A0A7W9N1Y1_9MICC|nr:hypothetical protein [Micrococcus endophyticus]MBB5849764.1 hypothetical protein [Micrococcus endophyticus]
MTGGRAAGPDGVAFSTHGGPGSLYAETEQMRAVAAGHDRAAGEALRVAGTAESAGAGLVRAPRVSPAAAVLQARLWEGLERVRALSDRCARMDRDLRAAAVRYEEAERAAAGIVAAEDVGLGALPLEAWRRGRDGLTTREAERLGEVAVQAVPEAVASAVLTAAGFPALAALARIDLKKLSWWQRKTLKRPVSRGASRLVEEASEGTELLRVSPDEAWTAVGAVARALSIAADREVAVAGPPEDRPDAPARLDGSAADLLGLIPRGGVEGELTVTRVERERGGPAWVVGLPGTQGGFAPDHASRNPWDASGLADALTADSAATAPAVRAALEAAGVPHGAPLVLAGYSQGGVHAVNLAGDAGFTAAYPVAGVVTVAAPSGNAARTGGAAVLEFSSDADLATAVDGAPVPASRHRAEVVFHPGGQGWGPPPAPGEEPGAAPAGGFRTAGPDAVGEDLTAAHDFDGHLAMVRQFEAADPAARAEVAGLSATLAGLSAGAVASSRSVRLRRAPAPREAAGSTSPVAPGGPGRR